VMLRSTKRKLMRKFVDTLASKNVTRAALIDILLEKYFPEVLVVVQKIHGRVTLDALLKSHSIEALDSLLKSHSIEALESLAKIHFSEMIAAMCRNHLQEVIAKVIETKGGTFQYVVTEESG